MIKGEYMTKKIFTKKLKTNLLLFFTIICLVCSCMFGLFACEQEDVNVNDPTISVDSESSDVLIKNATFKIDTANKELKNFPLTSPNGWSKATTDKSSSTAAVNSGTINTTDTAWEVLLSTLYDDTDFLNYATKVFGFKVSDAEAAIKAEKGDSYVATTTEIKEYCIENYLSAFVNPRKSPDAQDDFVYMLNNINKPANLGFGTAQKITSSSSITMEKGKTYELSVWVKTANITGLNSGNYGANIRLTNSINGTSQADYRISNIIANDWTKYSFYIKADADYTCTFTLVLGLGYGNGNANDATYFTEGTAYFDEISIKTVDSIPSTITSTDKLAYNNEDPIEATLFANACAYDMNFSHSEGTFFTNILSSATLDNKFTTSNIKVDNGSGTLVPLTSAIKVGASSTQTLTKNSDSAVVEVNKASATLTIKDNSFKLDNGEYALVSFSLKNQLVGPASTNVYIDVFDVNGSEVIKNASAITVSDVDDDFVEYVFLIKNNFETGPVREFYFDVVVGPNDVASIVYDSDFATGSVSIKDLKINKGNQDDENDMKTFFSSLAESTVALHAGFENDFTEDSNDATYDFSSQPGNFGDIIFNPTTVKEYTGVVPNHAYLSNKTDAETAINTRINLGTVNGVAGLINTKYLNNYANGAEIASKLGYTAGDEDFQAIMINNKTANHYGFVGSKTTIDASANGLVSVTLKVLDNAVAYLYLVDVSSVNKEVLTFNDFTVNTDVVDGVAKGTEIDGSTLKYAIKVDSSMMDADGWATVSFYVGAGKQSKSFRLEVWNGDRSGDTDKASQGYVFVKSAKISTSSAFTEAEKWNQTFTISGNPLYEHHKSSFNTLYAYQRELTDTQIAFNKEYPDEAISYQTKYVWAQSDRVIYGVFNTIDPVYTDPYADKTDDTTTDSGCAAKTDPSTFWLSFSSILLAVVLFAAIIVLIIKNVRARRKANRNDAISHYKVSSRISKKPNKIKEVVEEETVEPIEQTTEEASQEDAKESTEETEDYVYGEVESFDTDIETEKQPTEETEENTNNE